MTDWAVITAETVALKVAVVAPAGTVTDAGTVTATLLLARLTASPPVGAAAFTVTVQASVPAPAMELLVQVTADGTGVPVPVRATAPGEGVRGAAAAANPEETIRKPQVRRVSSVAQVRVVQPTRDGVAVLSALNGNLAANLMARQKARRIIDAGGTTIPMAYFFPESVLMRVFSLPHVIQSVRTEVSQSVAEFAFR